MRQSTAVIVASVVETTRDHVVPRQQHFLDHEQTFTPICWCRKTLVTVAYTAHISD